MEVREHETKQSETDKYRWVKDHSFNTFLYTIVNTMALKKISITRMSKWTFVMSYVITLEDKY